MPKAALYRLTWVPEHRIYALRDAQNNEQMLPFAPGSAEWFFWLSSIPSFTFTGQHGQLTVRQEARGGAGTYWYAYRRHGDKMLKRYLGRTADLTPAHLEEVALQLIAPSVSSPKQELSARDPSQEHGPAQGRYQRPSPQAEGASGEVASLPPELSLAKLPPSHTGTAPRVLHHGHHDARDLLLATKLHLPRPRAQLIPRSHLVERLQQGVAGALTLVSAPAGYGKTTLLAQWRASTRVPVAWLSLEPEDDEPVRFLTYFIAALQRLDPHLGARAQAWLSLPQPAELATVLTLLTNDLLGWQGEDFVLVLDDYHVITATPIHRTLTHLLEHLPPQIHLIIATRSDPPLPLARLRARGHLTELRAAELRFEAAETGAFLAEVMGLRLSQEEATTLQTRTEGWITGLQLAALSLQGRADVASALAAFTGSHRFVLDYLSEEVLSRQPAEVQTFLLQTAMLSRLSGSLCDAVTGQEWATQMQDFLLALHEACHQWRLLHLTAVPAIERDDWVARSFEILAAGYAAQPPPPASSSGKQKGRRKQSKAKNLLDTLLLRAEQVLALLDDLRIPFTNNQAERDLRWAKVQQKIAGTFRSATGVTAFCRIRSYLSTMHKQGHSMLSALTAVFHGQPLPVAWGPE